MTAKKKTTAGPATAQMVQDIGKEHGVKLRVILPCGATAGLLVTLVLKMQGVIDNCKAGVARCGEAQDATEKLHIEAWRTLHSDYERKQKVAGARIVRLERDLVIHKQWLAQAHGMYVEDDGLPVSLKDHSYGCEPESPS